MYDNRLQNLPLQTALIVSQIDELKGRWSASGLLMPQSLSSLRRSTLITSAGASTRIEGAKMTDRQIEEYLNGLKIQKFAERDAQEVRGYYEALEFIFDNYQQINLSENSIKLLHSRLLEYCSNDAHHRGNYKRIDNRVEMTDGSGNVLATVFETTPVYLTSKAMEDLIDWHVSAIDANKYHPLLIISSFVVSFLKIHPFLDGNGRLSRLLTNCLLLRCGYEYIPFVSHEKLIENTKAEYYQALRNSQSTLGSSNESINDWMLYFLNTLLTQAKKAVDLLQDTNFEQELSPKQLVVWHYLNTVIEATPKSIASATDVKRATVSQALNKLVKLKRVKRLGYGRTTRYKRI